MSKNSTCVDRHTVYTVRRLYYRAGGSAAWGMQKKAPLLSSYFMPEGKMQYNVRCLFCLPYFLMHLECYITMDATRHTLQECSISMNGGEEKEHLSKGSEA